MLLTLLRALMANPSPLLVSAALTVGALTPWLPPLGAPLQLLEQFNLAKGPYAAGHRGVDLPATEAQQVVAPSSGVVSFTGTVVDRPTLTIRVDDHTLLSLEPVISSLEPGDTVTRGQPIGVIASGGHCQDRCLHLGVRVETHYVNPMRFLLGRPVLVRW